MKSTWHNPKYSSNEEERVITSSEPKTTTNNGEVPYRAHPTFIKLLIRK